jgi:hypothetical protein
MALAASRHDAASSVLTPSETDLALEPLVSGGVDVPHHGVGDVGVDVERRGARRPVAGALLPADRPPRERGARQPELIGAFPRQAQRHVPPGEGVGRGRRMRVGQHRQHERLGVPEGVPVVPRPGQALGGDHPPFGARARLQDVEQPEPDGLLDLGVAVDLDVGAGPELVEVGALLLEQPVPAGVPGRSQRGHHLVVQRGTGAPAGPPVRQVLHDPQPLPRLQPRGDRQPCHVGIALDVGRHVVGTLDVVVHRGGHPQPAVPGAVHHHRLGVVGDVRLADQRRFQHRGGARVAAEVGQRLVGHQFRLRHDPHRAVDRLDLVADRGDGPLGERHQPDRGDAHPASGRRGPLHLPGERAAPHVQQPLVGVQPPVPHIERLVVHQQPDQLAVGDVDDRLARLRVAVARLGVRQGPQLVERVEVAARQPVRIALVQVAAQAHVAVGEGEHRLGLRQAVQPQLRLPHAPRFDHEDRLLRAAGASAVPVAHSPSSSSERSPTTLSAPCRASAAP